MTFKVLSAVLSYPTAELKAAAADMKAIIQGEALLSAELQQSLLNLIDEFSTTDLYELQERYVFLFDRTRSLSLHLFEHVHGESRDRGQAMVDLAQLYEQNGLFISNRELPDYLPLFLEFLSTLPESEAQTTLTQPLHIISALAERLNRRDSAYAAPFYALESLAVVEPEAVEVQAILDEAEDNPNDFEQLDRLWHESEVVFGPGSGQQGDCSQGSNHSAGVRVAIPTHPKNQELSRH